MLEIKKAENSVADEGYIINGSLMDCLEELAHFEKLPEGEKTQFLMEDEINAVRIKVALNRAQNYAKDIMNMREGIVDNILWLLGIAKTSLELSNSIQEVIDSDEYSNDKKATFLAILEGNISDLGVTYKS